MNQYVKTLTNGFIKENPTFVLLLGMCPTLATTTSGKNGLMMGLATTFVLICSNLVISLLKKLIPDAVRIPAFIVVIAGFVTVLQLLIQAFLPDLNNSLGIFIPLIVVNCIVLGRAESVASKQNPVLSILLGSVREFIGSCKVFEQLIYPDSYGALLFILPPGAFMVLGCLIALFNVITKKS